MKIFVTGANGFIGGAIAARLMADGHSVRGLVRDPGNAPAVAAQGMVPVLGTLDDFELLKAEASLADAVLNAASSDHRPGAEALLAGLLGSGKAFLHTSGSSIVGDEAMGEPSDRVFHEGTPLRPEPEKVARVALDQMVLQAPGVRSVVLCNTMIYGRLGSSPAESVQVPALARQALQSGVPHYIGRGLNRWSNTHISDVADLYALALNKAPAGTFLFVENGEETLGAIAQAIGIRLGLGEAMPLAPEKAIATWGRELAVFALGSNSRVRGTFAREKLGWEPKQNSITEWIHRELEVPRPN